MIENKAMSMIRYNPTIDILFCFNRDQPSCQKFKEGLTFSFFCSASFGNGSKRESLIILFHDSNPRIYKCIRDIHQEVQSHQQNTIEDCDTHYHRIIPVINGRDKVLSQSRNSKDTLHQEASCKDRSNQWSQIGYYR